MAQSNMSGPLSIDGALVVGGAATIAGGITFSGGTINAENALDVTGGTITVADIEATGLVSAGNFTSLGTAGIHNAVTVHSLVNEGALTALGTTGLQATTVFGALNVIGTAGVHAAVSVHSLASEGAITATTISGTDLSMVGTAGVHGELTAHSIVDEGALTTLGTLGVHGTAFGFGTQIFGQAASIPVAGGFIGNIRWNTAPVVTGPIGWVCTAPGVWSAFGTIAA